MDIYSEAMEIHPIYERYEKQISTLLPKLTRIGISLILLIYGIGFIHNIINLRFPKWEQWILIGLSLLAFTLLLISAFIENFFSPSKRPDILMSEQFALDKVYLGELRTHSMKARRRFQEYIKHVWDVRDATDKSMAAIIISVGGLLSLIPEWIGKPKSSLSFLIIVTFAAYCDFISHQRIIANLKRFGYLLELDEEAEQPKP